jgi:uncharacterized protein YkwD
VTENDPKTTSDPNDAPPPDAEPEESPQPDATDNPPSDSEDTHPDNPPEPDDPDPSDDDPTENPNQDNESPDEQDPPSPDEDTPEDPESPDPQVEYCDIMADWPDAYAAFEAEVLALVNEERALGADCGSAGSFEAAPALTMNAALQCAARNHSMDMHERSFFSHTNPDGDGPRQRADRAGYSGSRWGENIAWGYTTPAAVVNGWMNSDGHCANIMRASFTELGVGYYDGNLWTLSFGGP